VVRQLLREMLRPSRRRLLLARDVSEACDAIRGGEVEFALIDANLSGGGAERVFEAARHLPGTRPRIIVLSRRPSLEEETAFSLFGASGYLPKPVALRDLKRLLFRADAGDRNKAANRVPLRSPVVAVCLSERAEPAITWEVRDLSRRGAFLATEGPLPLGHTMQLELAAGSTRCAVAARVVRINDPSWDLMPGTAVEFVHSGDARALDAFCEGLSSAVPLRAREKHGVR
ncbi:MAG: PilZ domain-containing protein, partial [Burkholderiales bacterium]